MKVLITGAGGQLGRSLQQSVPTDIDMVATGSDELDICDSMAVWDMISAQRPDVIINAAAYTAVDRAEAEEELAFRVNAEGVDRLARAAGSTGAKLVHVSSDFVFAGDSSVPYLPGAATAPLNAYGRSKLAGEHAAGSGAVIVRTAWLYGPRGNNFVHTMLRLLRERDALRVVSDQIGTPTYAPSLAAAIWKLAGRSASGIYHYTDSGVASWYDFAVAIQEEALEAGLLDRIVPIVPIATADYPVAARRPQYSVLDKRTTFAELDQVAPHWRTNLRQMMKDLRHNV